MKVVLLQSLAVHNFYFGEGSDKTGVPTKMLTVNCSVRMTIYNPATFFGIHVSSTPINLMYSEITVASGQVNFLSILQRDIQNQIEHFFWLNELKIGR